MSISASSLTTRLIVSLLTMSAMSMGNSLVSMSWQHGHHQNAPEWRRVACLDEMLEWYRKATLPGAGLIGGD